MYYYNAGTPTLDNMPQGLGYRQKLGRDRRAWYLACYQDREATYWAGPWEMSAVDIKAAEACRWFHRTLALRSGGLWEYKWKAVQDPDPFRQALARPDYGLDIRWRPPFHERFSVLAADQYNAGIIMGFPGYTSRTRRDRFAWHDARYRGRMAAYWAGPWPCGVPEACPKCQGPAQWQHLAEVGTLYRCGALHRWIVCGEMVFFDVSKIKGIVIKGTLSV